MSNYTYTRSGVLSETTSRPNLYVTRSNPFSMGEGPRLNTGLKPVRVPRDRWGGRGLLRPGPTEGSDHFDETTTT